MILYDFKLDTSETKNKSRDIVWYYSSKYEKYQNKLNLSK